MPHVCQLIDDDNRFIIDGETRELTKLTDTAPLLMQYDHNSERYGFQMPRFIEGHDMSQCDLVEVHYTNTSKGTSKSSRTSVGGRDIIQDLAIDENDPDTLLFSWLITQNATQVVGTLVFQFKFICYGEGTELSYLWHTEQYSFIPIRSSLNNTGDLIVEYPDAIESLALRVSKLEQQLGEGGSIGDRVEDLEDQVSDLQYNAITITKFTNNVGTVEIGSTVNEVTFDWAFNKTPSVVILNGVHQAVDSTGATLSGLSVKPTSVGTKSWMLTAMDERAATASKSSGVSFVNGIYYGVSSAQSGYGSAFIRGLTRVLRDSRLSSIEVNAGEGQYIFYCLPSRIGYCEFKVGGFDGGFVLADTIEFTNASGYTEEYYIYRSTNAGLGSTTVGISAAAGAPTDEPDDPTVDPDEPTVDPDDPTVDPDNPDDPDPDPDEPDEPDGPTERPDDIPSSTTGIINSFYTIYNGDFAGYAEKGSTLEDIRLICTFNSRPATVTLDGVEQTLETSFLQVDLNGINLTSDKTWEIVATDADGNSETATTSMLFINGVYYGDAAKPAVYDSSFILGLDRKLQKDKYLRAEVQTSSNEYVYFCMPSRYGQCTFVLGDSVASFESVSTINFTNASGYTEEYDIYRSTTAESRNTILRVGDYTDKASYVPMKITQLTQDTADSQKGTTIDSIGFGWTFNKTPAKFTINGAEQTVPSTGVTLTDLGLTEYTEFTFVATDELGITDVRTLSVLFINHIYYGTAAIPAAYDSAFILGLNEIENNWKVQEFNVNAAEGQYIFYCLDSTYECVFRSLSPHVNLEFVNEGPINFTNEHGYTTSYSIYRSVDAGLGERTISAEDPAYKAMRINSFIIEAENTTSTSSKDWITAELNSTVNEVTLSWDLNKVPTTIKLDGETLSTDLTSITLTDLGITESNTWTLTVTDEKGVSVAASVRLDFQNCIYYGAAEAQDEYTNDFVLSLTRRINDDVAAPVYVNARADQYLYYCLPSRMGEHTFSPAFTHVETMDVTNSSGYTEEYYIYRSNATGLGRLTVTPTYKSTSPSYVPIKIFSFTSDVGVVEPGTVVDTVTLQWALNKTPVELYLDGVAQDVNSYGVTLTGLNLTTDKVWELEAIDELRRHAVAVAAVSFEEVN